MAITDRKSGSASGSSTSNRLAGVPEGIAVKAPVRVATTANITLIGLQSVDGVTVAAGDRVLVKDQTDQRENGIRVASTGIWERADDFSVNGHVVEGTRVYVNQGSANGNTEWYVTTDDDIVIGTSDIVFGQQAVPNSQLADMAAYTLQGRNAGTTGDPSAISIAALTEKTTLANNDLVLIQDSAASNAFKKVKAVNLSKNGFVTPQQYGALADGSDDYQAFVDAIAAAVAAGHKTVYVPPGTYDLGTRLLITDDNVCIYGLSRRTTIIRRRSGATLVNLIHIGLTSGTTTITGVKITGIGFDGNGSCSDAAVKLRNANYCEVSNVRCYSATGDGIKSDTRTSIINTGNVRNCYFDIEADTNTGNGMQFIGEKESQYDSLLPHNNSASGAVFRAFEFDSGTLTETTQCTIGTILSDDNAVDGVVFDGCEKYTAASILATQNLGWGIRFRSTDVSASGVANNNVNIAVASMRGNQAGGIKVGDSAKMNGAQFGHVTVIGGGGIAGETGIHLEGVSNVLFGSVLISIVAGPGIRILAGTPLGVAGDSSAILFGSVRLNFNGQVNTGAIHSLSIEGGTTEVSITSFISAGQNTSGTNYEVIVAGTASDVVIGHASINSASGSNGVSGSVTFTGRYELEGVEQSTGSALTDGDKGDITVSSSGTVWNIDADTVGNTELANMAQATVKGRQAGSGTGDPEDLTATQARTALGLGTAATQNTGTSGANVPLLNGSNVWSGFFSMQIATASQSTLDIRVDDAGAFGPSIKFHHNSASSAVGDRILDWQAQFQSSTGVNRTGFACYSVLDDNTNASEDTSLQWSSIVAGTLTQQWQMGNGLQIGSPTGGYKGLGSINAKDVYNDDVALTCMALSEEFISKGEINLQKWDDLVPDDVTPARKERVPRTTKVRRRQEGLVRNRETGHFTLKAEDVDVEIPLTRLAYIHDESGILLDAIEEPIIDVVEIPEKRTPRRHELAHRFKAMCDDGFDPRDPVQYIAKLKRDQALPGMPTQADWQHNAIGTGELFCRQWLAMEMLALVVVNLHERLEALEQSKKRPA
jgi:hypothetical protein